MKKSEVIQLLKEGKICIENDDRDNKILLKEILNEAFPDDFAYITGVRDFYGRSKHNEKHWHYLIHSIESPHIAVKLSQITKDTMDSRFPFSLSRKDAQRIIDIACAGWRDRLIKKWSSLVIQDTVEISEEFYKEMRAACTREQNKLFDEIFGTPIEWFPNHIYLLKMDGWDTPFICVSANKVGTFYCDGRTKGYTTSFPNVKMLKIIGAV